MIFIIASVISYAAYMHPRYGHLFPYVDGAYRSIGEFISSNTGYQDVVFSPNHEIPVSPSQKLSYSMKRVYKIQSLEEIYNKVKTIREDFEINLLLVGDDESDSPDIEMLIAAAYEVRHSDDMYLSLYKINPNEFIRLAHPLHKSELYLE